MNIRTVSVVAVLVGVLFPIHPSHATQALTAAECVQAQRTSVDMAKMGRDKGIYKTREEGQEAARRRFAKQIQQELGETGAVSAEDRLRYRNMCINRKAPGFSKAMGMLGEMVNDIL